MSTRKMRVVPSDLSRNGTVQRKVTKSELWADHDCDMNPRNWGRRLATRGAVCASLQYGMANLYGAYMAVDFMWGESLWDAPIDDGWRVVNVMTGKTIGYAQCHEALAYRIAAARTGVTLEVYND